MLQKPQITQHLHMGGDTLNPNHIIQYPYTGGDTSNPNILSPVTRQKLPTSQGGETFQTPIFENKQPNRSPKQGILTNTQ